jgi:phosphate transport system permease protein
MSGVEPAIGMADGGPVLDPAAPLTASGNLRRRQIVSRIAVGGATAAAAAAVGVLAMVVWSVVSHGAKAISLEFFLEGEPDGIGPAILGTAEISLGATLIAAPLGVLIAVYMTEFAKGRLAKTIQVTLDLVNGLPSIIIGLFVFGLLVYGHAQSAYAASIALAIIMLPLVARGSQEVLRLVPETLREASDALGVSRWRSVLTVVLPSALGGILTATILALARAAGETAPLLLIDSVFRGETANLNPLEAVPNIPVTIYRLSEEANPEGFTRAWGAGLALLSFIMFTGLAARYLLARSKRKLGEG